MGYTQEQLEEFIIESNRIEGIPRHGFRVAHLRAHEEFLALLVIQVKDLEKLVSIVQPGAKLRDRRGMDVRVGTHRPRSGGPHIREALAQLLIDSEGLTPWETHRQYETLHPFIDGNGRSGRALWAWQMLDEGRSPGLARGFLHEFYYQTLQESR